MATTTNYSWTTPDDTDLVKDGASAIRTLGSSVDTTTKNLNPETTLGDIAYRSSTANVKTRLGLGTAGQVLTVNSGANAPEWAAPVASGGMTSIASGSLTGSSIVLSSIPATYYHLQLILRDLFITGTGSPNIKLNAITNYNMLRFIANANTFVSDALTNNGNFILGYDNVRTSDCNSCFVVNIYDYNNSVAKEINALISYQDSSNNQDFMSFNGNAVMSAAVTSITIAGVTFAGGTYELFGVK
jgi:hypothetical protein